MKFMIINFGYRYVALVVAGMQFSLQLVRGLYRMF